MCNPIPGARPSQGHPLRRREPGFAPRRGRVPAALLLLAAVLGVACASHGEPEDIRVGVCVFTGYAPLAGALRTYTPPVGSTPVRLQRFSAYSDSLRAFRNGRLDLVAMTQYDALMMHGRGVPLRAVALIDRSLGADALVAQPEYDTLRELRGRRIGLSVDSVSYLLLLQALERHNLSIEEFEIVNLSQNLLEDAFRERQVEAAVLWEPFVSSLGDRARPLLTSRDLKIPIVDLLWVRADRMPRLRRHLLPLLRHYFATLDALTSDPAAMHARLAEEDRVPPREVRLALRGLRLFGSRDNVTVARRAAGAGSGPPPETALRQTADFLYARTLLAVPLDTSSLFDPSLTLEALEAGSPVLEARAPALPETRP